MMKVKSRTPSTVNIGNMERQSNGNRRSERKFKKGRHYQGGEKVRMKGKKNIPSNDIETMGRLSKGKRKEARKFK